MRKLYQTGPGAISLIFALIRVETPLIAVLCCSPA